jgi:hypothetical protein
MQDSNIKFSHLLTPPIVPPLNMELMKAKNEKKTEINETIELMRFTWDLAMQHFMRSEEAPSFLQSAVNNITEAKEYADKLRKELKEEDFEILEQDLKQIDEDYTLIVEFSPIPIAEKEVGIIYHPETEYFSKQSIEQNTHLIAKIFQTAMWHILEASKCLISKDWVLARTSCDLAKNALESTENEHAQIYIEIIKELQEQIDSKIETELKNRFEKIEI